MVSLVVAFLLSFQQGGYTYPSEHAFYRPGEVFVLGAEMPSATPKTKAPAPPKVQPITVPSKPIKIEIPEVKPPSFAPVEVKKVEETVYFDFDSFKIRENEKGKLDRLPRDLKYEITGYTCDLGSKEYNDRLALRRAISVRDYLRVEAEVSGKGKCCYAESKNREKNRRVEIKSK